MLAAAHVCWLASSQRTAVAHTFDWRSDGSSELAWNWDPIVLPGLVLASWLYVRGLRKIWKKAGTGRVVARWQAAAFAGGIVFLAVALISPLETLAEELSSAHMVQHMLLKMMAAPLLILGGPVLVMLRGLPRKWRFPIGRGLRWIERWPGGKRLLWNPLFAWTAYAAVLWIWHLPDLYQAALRNNLVHVFQHLNFFVAALLFWRVAIDPASPRRMSLGLGVLYLFTTSLHASALGVLMTFSPEPWYPEYLGSTETWGLTPLEDQQIAGLIMWMPAGMMYAMAALGMFVLWLAKMEAGEQAAGRFDRGRGTLGRIWSDGPLPARR